MQEALKREIHDVISGKSQVRFGATVQAVASYLGEGAQTGTGTEDPKQVKRQEAARLEKFIAGKGLWVTDIDLTQYVSEGAEQRVFLKAPDHVLKLNDAIYYSSWRDYFHSLLLHNFFFADTAYKLIGFTKEDDVLYAIVEQAYVSITSNTDLNMVKDFLASNGFQNTRNNDYYNPDLGIILEDLHDENVLTRNNVLYFIDTVFYLTKDFWSEQT
jgi:hypothetical protein